MLSASRNGCQLTARLLRNNTIVQRSSGHNAAANASRLHFSCTRCYVILPSKTPSSYRYLLTPKEPRRRLTSGYKLSHTNGKPPTQQPGTSSHYYQHHQEQQQQSSEFYFFRVLFYRLAVAYGGIYCISEYLFQLTNCNGPSMMPTLKPVAEIIFVDRLTPRMFGLDGGSTAQERIQHARQRQKERSDTDVWHQPFIPANRLPQEGKWKRFVGNLKSGISIGDVVVVEHPQREGTICKRVLGLPGDEIILKKSSYSTKSKGLLKVPDGHLWLEGDNSANSLDSRTYGPVPAAMIVGRVPFRVWPLRGDAMIERGMRPTPRLGEPLWGAQGSTVLPAGYLGETILKGDEESKATQKRERKSSM